MRPLSRLTALALAGALTLTSAGAYAPQYSVSTVSVGTYVPQYNVSATAGKADLPKSFAVGAKVLSGDQNGDMNWDGSLTRAEAATMLLRLMGLEEEAQAVKDQPSPFTDVPAWANGYVNLAQEKGIVKGVGEGRFDPSGSCGAKEFLVMLFRLTRLTEGTDYSWATAVDDFYSAVSAVENDRAAYLYSPSFNYGAAGKAFQSYVNYNGPFTREAAAGAMYLMLSIDAGENRESLGDILAEDYGLSSLLLFDNEVRRTAGTLAEQTSLSISGFTGEKPTLFTLDGGKLHVDDPTGAKFQTSESDNAGWVYLSNSQPLALPREDHTVILSYHENIGSFVNEDGELYPIGATQDVSLPILYRDGRWTFGPRSRLIVPDLTYMHAYRDEAHWVRVMDSEYPAHVLDGYITEEIRSLAAALTAGKTSDYAKTEAICRWVSTQIFYDVDSVTGSRADQSAAQVLATRKAVCDGYARLTRELMRSVGLECYTESSIASNHAWNVARLNGRWVMIDNTKDSQLKYRDGVYLNYKTGTGQEVENYLEPEGVWLRWNFDADLDDFYDSHKLDREPLVID